VVAAAVMRIAVFHVRVALCAAGVSGLYDHGIGDTWERTREEGAVRVQHMVADVYSFEGGKLGCGVCCSMPWRGDVG
jgi:hypothetical protein